jgi:hypothetical protein
VSSKIAADAIVAEKIAAGEIDTEHLKASAVTAAKIAAGTITANEIQSGTITAAEIASNTITATQIASETITAAEIESGAITTDKLDALAITASKIAVNAITSGKITANAITTAKIEAGAIGADEIAADEILAKHIGSNEVITDSAQIRDAIIDDAKIKDASITDAKIKDATITNAKINGGTITADKFNSTLYGDLNQAMMLTKKIMSGGDEYEYFLDQNDLDNATKTNIDATHHVDYGLSIRLATQKLWDEGTWDSGTWDIPVESSGTFESISNDIGLLSTFQISFECILQKDPATDITVEAIYSTDNTNWGTNRGTLNDNMWETLLMQEIGSNIFRFSGSLFSFRYFKIRITLSTSDTSQRIILYNCKYYGNVVNMYGFFENEQIASGGKSFSIQGFNDPPAVNVTPKGTSPLVSVVNNVSIDGFTVQLFDLSGSDVGGNADIIYMGV